MTRDYDRISTESSIQSPKRIGTYDGAVPLERLASRAGAYPYHWEGATYNTTVDVTDAFSAELAGVFPSDAWQMARLIVINGRGGNIHLHHDEALPEGIKRYHLVLATNDGCWNYHGGDWQQLEIGGIYVMDPTGEHASINFGQTQRVHLVVDC